jgi:hypothetical protein
MRKDERVARRCVMSMDAEEPTLLGAVTRQRLVKAENFVCAVVTVIGRVCRSAELLQLPVVTTYKCPINPVINPNPVSSH